MDERLNSRQEDDRMATRRTVTRGVAAGGLAALFAAVGAGRVLADEGPDDNGDDGPEDDLDDTVDDVDDGTVDDTTGDDGAVDDTTGDDSGTGDTGGPGGGAVKGHHKNRKRGKKGRH